VATAPYTSSAARPAAAPDPRRGRRNARFERARITFEGLAFDCLVENLSDNGARVRFGNPIALPELFVLRFQDGRSRPVERRWADTRVVGIRYSDAGPANDAGPVAETERRRLVRAVQEAVAAGDRAEALRLGRHFLALWQQLRPHS